MHTSRISVVYFVSIQASALLPLHAPQRGDCAGVGGGVPNQDLWQDTFVSQNKVLPGCTMAEYPRSALRTVYYFLHCFTCTPLFLCPHPPTLLRILWLKRRKISTPACSPCRKQIMRNYEKIELKKVRVSE